MVWCNSCGIGTLRLTSYQTWFGLVGLLRDPMLRTRNHRFFLNRASGCGVKWSMESAPTLSATETVTANLRMILRGILAVLGMWRVEPTVARVLFGRINGTFGRIERLLLRFRAGRLWRVTQRGGTQRQHVHRKQAVALPRRFGWLVQAGGYQAAGFGSQLQTVLNAPEMTELLAASPQARRILRPLCRALAVEVPGVSGAPRKVEDHERPKRIRASRPKPEPFKIPLPRGALSWARREGFGKLC